VKPSLFSICCLRHPRALAVAACLAFAFSSYVPQATCAEEPAGPKLELSDKVSEAMGPIYKLIPDLDTTKNYAPVIEGLTGIAKTCKPGTYDEFHTAQLLAQVYASRGQKGDYAAALPWFTIFVNSPIFALKPNYDFLFLTAQLYLNENDPVNAEKYVRRYLDLVPKPALDRIVFFCSILLQRAESTDPVTKKVVTDKAVINEALKWVNKGMRLQTKPDDRLLLMKSVSYIALEQFDPAAETLELAVKLFPKNRQYWPQLYNLYANAQRDLRAALTIERAQAEGMMNTPKENTVLVSIYYNLRRYDKAIELLESGLADGKLESTPTNWELLASTYVQSRKELKAIETYKRASEKFPETGKYDALTTQMYFSLDQTAEAYKYAKQAVAKGGGDKPAQMGLFTVFLAYELKKFSEAADYLEKVKPLLKTEQDQKDFDNLKRAVDGAVEAAASDAAAKAAEAAKPTR
jgi:tetratricopeptide (TPR) repeat protein